MRVLVTGASGFIGSHLLQHLLPQHQVFALARSPAPPAPIAGAAWIAHDLTQPLAADRLPAPIDAVIHLAQSRLYKQFPAQARDIWTVNVAGTFDLLEYARYAGATHFIFASTGGVYQPGPAPIREAGRVDPSNFYTRCKYSAELLIGGYQSFFHTTILRLFFVYGPGQQGMLIPNLLHKVRHDERVSVEGDPGLRINPIYVDDAVRAIAQALHRAQSDLINIAGDDIVTMTGLVNLMAEVTGHPAHIQHGPASHESDLVADNRRMKAVLQVQPQVALSEGLRRTLAAGPR